MIILKNRAKMEKDKYTELREDILKQMKEGTVILPWHVDFIAEVPQTKEGIAILDKDIIVDWETGTAADPIAPMDKTKTSKTLVELECLGCSNKTYINKSSLKDGMNCPICYGTLSPIGELTREEAHRIISNHSKYKHNNIKAVNNG